MELAKPFTRQEVKEIHLRELKRSLTIYAFSVCFFLIFPKLMSSKGGNLIQEAFWYAAMFTIIQFHLKLAEAYKARYDIGMGIGILLSILHLSGLVMIVFFVGSLFTELDYYWMILGIPLSLFSLYLTLRFGKPAFLKTHSPWQKT